MSEHIRKLKENAARLAAKGKLEDAADAYLKAIREDPHDLTARQRLAEVYVRLGRTARAVAEYQSVAGRYVADGLLLKAIAICKIILQVDPSHKETQRILADLSTQRRGSSGVLHMPAAMSKALIHPQRRAESQMPASGRPLLSLPGTPGELSPGPALAQVSPRQTAHGSAGEDESSGSPNSRPPAADLSGVSARAAAIAALDAGALHKAPPNQKNDAKEDRTSSVMLEAGSPVVMDHAGFSQPAGAPIVTPSSHASRTHDLALHTGTQAAEDFSVDVDVSFDHDDASLASSPHASESNESFIDVEGSGRIDLDQLPSIPLFSDLPREAFIALMELMELRAAATGEVLMQEGEVGSSMFIIIQGRVVVKRLVGDAAQAMVLAELGDGAFFGEMALIADSPRVATVVCAEDALLFEISRQLLAQIVQQHPSMAEAMRRFHKNRLLHNLLSTCPIFRPFAPDDRKALVEKFTSITVEAGTSLVTRARQGDGLYVVLSGRCHVVDTTPDNKELFLAELKEGDVFGEMSMLEHKQTMATVKAATPCVVLCMARATFDVVRQTHPQILEALARMSERRAQQNSELFAVDIATDFIV